MESIFFMGVIGNFEIYQLVLGSECYTHLYDSAVDRAVFYSSVCESFIETFLQSGSSLDLVIMNGKMISKDLKIRAISPIDEDLLCKFTNLFCQNLIGRSVSKELNYEN